MIKRQNDKSVQMLRFYAQQINGVSLHVFREEPWEGYPELESTNTDLDRHLPQTRNAQESLIIRCLDQLTSMRAESRISAVEP